MNFRSGAIKKIVAKLPDMAQTGWFSFRARPENHPVLAIIGGFAIIS
jgi:hypothetical protein